MSDDQQSQHTAVLLPGARVVVFTRDPETRETFTALQKDWRFARVVIDVRDGDADTAVQAFQTEISPDLVVVQTDSIEDGFSARLEALAGSCAEGTAAIVIGPVNDVNLYRRLISMGVSDYLVRPVKPEPLGHDIAATLLRKIGAGDSHLIALVGAKGGVGTTVLSQALAWGVADRLGQKTFLLDTSGGWSTLSVGMNFEPTTTLAEAVRAAAERNEDSLSRMMFSPAAKLTVLTSGGDVMLDDIVSPEGYENLLNLVMTTYPVVVVDLSASPAALKRTVLSRAHQVILVTAPVLPAIRATRTLLSEIKHLRGNREDGVDIVLNMTGMTAKAEVPKAQIEEGLERKPAAVIPFDPSLFIRTESEARKLYDDKAGAAIVDRLLMLARKVVTVPGEGAEPEAGEPKKLGGLMTKLKKKS